MFDDNKYLMKLSIGIQTLTLILFLFFIVLSSAKSTFAQTKTFGEVSFLDSIVFRDSLNGWTTDSIDHNIGIVPPVDIILVKYFKYIGNDTVTIKSAWTGAPHFINSYPLEPLVKGKIYSFTVSFFLAGMNRYFEKAMGFELSNGQRICYYFKGNIQKQDTNENH